MLPRIWNRWFNRLLKKSSIINKTDAKAPQLEKLEDFGGIEDVHFTSFLVQ